MVLAVMTALKTAIIQVLQVMDLIIILVLKIKLSKLKITLAKIWSIWRLINYKMKINFMIKLIILKISNIIKWILKNICKNKKMKS